MFLPAANLEIEQSNGSRIWTTPTLQRRSNLMMQANHSSSTQANSQADYDMPHESYAESLRVIGQALETLRISTFALTKDGDKFIVRNWEPSFLLHITNEVWGFGISGQTAFTNANSRDLLAYDSSDAERLETIGRTRRGAQETEEGFGISSGLRVVGDHLDKQRAVAFNIWWSTELVTVKYKTAGGTPKETHFTVQNLRDFGVGMYLRRSSRRRVK